MSRNGGVWQVTSRDAPPISQCTNNNLNICCQADFVNTHLYMNQSYKIASLGMFNNGYGDCTSDGYCRNNLKIKCTPPPTHPPTTHPPTHPPTTPLL